MSSKSTTSKYSTTASESGKHFGNNSSEIDEGSGEKLVMETGEVGLGISSETPQAIRGLLIFLHTVKPNQSVRSLLNGDAGSVVASLIGFSGPRGIPILCIRHL